MINLISIFCATLSLSKQHVFLGLRAGIPYKVHSARTFKPNTVIAVFCIPRTLFKRKNRLICTSFYAKTLREHNLIPLISELAAVDLLKMLSVLFAHFK